MQRRAFVVNVPHWRWTAMGISSFSELSRDLRGGRATLFNAAVRCTTGSQCQLDMCLSTGVCVGPSPSMLPRNGGVQRCGPGGRRKRATERPSNGDRAEM